MSEVGTTSKHTPGLWKVEEGEAEDLGAVVPALVVVTERDEEWICAFPPSDDAGTDRANAYLIAAAPELLMALQALLRQTNNIEVLGEWSGLDVNRQSQKRVRAEVDEVKAAAKAAIAKARGEQPS